MNVTVGDGNAGSNYQVHVCTPVSISTLEKKQNIYMTFEWLGFESLIKEMNAHIEELVSNSTDDPYHRLAKEWAWEYGQT